MGGDNNLQKKETPLKLQIKGSKFYFPKALSFTTFVSAQESTNTKAGQLQMKSFLFWAYVQFNPLLGFILESIEITSISQVCWYIIVVVGTPASEAVSWKTTSISIGLVQPDTSTSLLPGSVVMVCVQPCAEVVGLAGLQSLVHHQCGLEYNKLFDSEPATNLHELTCRCEAFEQ